ncbi:MAG: ACP phosphodiesterase [Saprospiraceae bacterium]
MNFLAHLFLSCNDEELLIGNFIADSIRNRDVANYSAGIQKGISLHRKIDSYTDNHPVVRQGTKRLQPLHRKYSAVIIDVFYDYLLVQNWERYSEQSLLDFTQRIYRILEQHQPILPTNLKRSLPKMIEHDWLRNYGRIEGIAYTFSRMEERVSQPKLLAGAAESLLRDEAILMEEFNMFFPDIVRVVEETCSC